MKMLDAIIFGVSMGWIGYFVGGIAVQLRNATEPTISKEAQAYSMGVEDGKRYMARKYIKNVLEYKRPI